MSVRFYNKYNQLITEQPSESGSAIENTLACDIILYVEVLEGTITLNFELMDNVINKWFPYQYDDGIKLNDYVRTLNPGKYRIILPTTKNENQIKVLYTGSNVLDANIYIVPNYNQF